MSEILNSTRGNIHKDSGISPAGLQLAVPTSTHTGLLSPSYGQLKQSRRTCSWNESITSSNCSQRAIEIVQRAIDEDINQNYAEAYKLYQNALDYFVLAHKC